MRRREPYWIWHRGVALVVAGLISGIMTAGHAQGVTPLDISTYVPLDNGRVWTYKWEIRIRGGEKHIITRTKSFEGPEFIPTGYAYKFVSDLGDYSLLSIENGELRLHGTVEPHRGNRFMFDPPVVLYAPNMVVGRAYKTTQQSGDEAGVRTWSTIVDGFEAVDTPMGRFDHCLKIRLEMDSANARSKAIYYYAQHVGLVAYQYTAWEKGQATPEVTVDARLKLTQVGGKTFTSVAQLSEWKAELASGMTTFDDPEARKLFRQAYERLYFWPAKFPGFEAHFTMKQESPATDPDDLVQGSIVVSPGLKIKVRGANKEAAIQIESEMSQFITHLKSKPFDSEFGEAMFSVEDRTSSQGIRITVSAPNTMGTAYRIKDGKILQIAHSYGRVRFVVSNTHFMDAGDGRLIATVFRITYYSNETGNEIGRIDFADEYVQVDGVWLPKRRMKTETSRGKTRKLVIEFSNHRVMK